MDVENGSIYPVFNVEKGAGQKGVYTYPNDEPAAYRGGRKQNEWTSDRDGVLVATAGHLHPGGLHTDLWVRRKGARIAKPACASKSSAERAQALQGERPARAGQQRPPVPIQGEVLRAGRRGVLGRGDDRHAPPTGR